jgi:hypothetical protein
MSKHVLYFDGVKVSGDFMTGVMLSDELIKSFDESWIPPYQRDRVLNKRKIESLREVFRTGAKIDSVKLNLIGEYMKDGRQAVASGTFRTIDGQQRLWALKESGVKGINIPVELYLNISESEEIELFHQFNRDPSKLTLGELAKSTRGTFSRVAVTKALKDRTLPIAVNVNSSSGGINLGLYASMLMLVHRKIYLKMLMMRAPRGKSVLDFLEQNFPEHHAAMCAYAVRNIMLTMTQIFGSYDKRASAYSRSFIQAYANVLVSNFMNDNGQIDFKHFKAKAKASPKLLENARLREFIASGGGSEPLLYNEIISFFNYKQTRHKLPMIEERLNQEISTEFKALAKRKEIETKQARRPEDKAAQKQRETATKRLKKNGAK